MPRVWDGYSPCDDPDPQVVEQSKEKKAQRIADAEKAVVAAARRILKEANYGSR